MSFICQVLYCVRYGDTKTIKVKPYLQEVHSLVVEDRQVKSVITKYCDETQLWVGCLEKSEKETHTIAGVEMVRALQRQ